MRCRAQHGLQGLHGGQKMSGRQSKGYDAQKNQEAMVRAVEGVREGQFQAFLDAIALIVAELDDELRSTYMKGLTEELVRQRRFLEVAVAMASSLVDADPDRSHLLLLASAQSAAGLMAAARKTTARARNVPDRNSSPRIERMVRERLALRDSLKAGGRTR